MTATVISPVVDQQIWQTELDKLHTRPPGDLLHGERSGTVGARGLEPGLDEAPRQIARHLLTLTRIEVYGVNILRCIQHKHQGDASNERHRPAAGR